MTLLIFLNFGFAHFVQTSVLTSQESRRISLLKLYV